MTQPIDPIWYLAEEEGIQAKESLESFKSAAAMVSNGGYSAIVQAYSISRRSLYRADLLSTIEKLDPALMAKAIEELKQEN